jgi:hypothetical protein
MALSTQTMRGSRYSQPCPIGGIEESGAMGKQTPFPVPGPNFGTLVVARLVFATFFFVVFTICTIRVRRYYTSGIAANGICVVNVLGALWCCRAVGQARPLSGAL